MPKCAPAVHAPFRLPSPRPAFCERLHERQCPSNLTDKPFSSPMPCSGHTPWKSSPAVTTDIARRRPRQSSFPCKNTSMTFPGHHCTAHDHRPCPWFAVATSSTSALPMPAPLFQLTHRLTLSIFSSLALSARRLPSAPSSSPDHALVKEREGKDEQSHADTMSGRADERAQCTARARSTRPPPVFSTCPHVLHDTINTTDMTFSPPVPCNHQAKRRPAASPMTFTARRPSL